MRLTTIHNKPKRTISTSGGLGILRKTRVLKIGYYILFNFCFPGLGVGYSTDTLSLFRWVANYHEHEKLLQENEEEKLSKEEQDMAWEVYRKSLEWEEVQKVSPGDTTAEQKLTTSIVAGPAPETIDLAQSRARNRFVTRKCTNLSHLLTLRSQGIKVGCSTICGECAQEISWEELNKDSKK